MSKKYIFYKLAHFFRKFRMGTLRYIYFIHDYNATWDNERAIEIPIAWKEVQKHSSDEILEVGNVLSHYFNVTHDVVDKYEKADKTIKTDIIDYNPIKKYSLIVLISTLEHIGWDEDGDDPEKIKKTLAHLKKLLKKDGKIIFTSPVGYSTYLDTLLFSKKPQLDSVNFLKRTRRFTTWQEIDKKSAKSAKYGKPFPNGNIIVVGEITKYMREDERLKK